MVVNHRFNDLYWLRLVTGGLADPSYSFVRVNFDDDIGQQSKSVSITWLLRFFNSPGLVAPSSIVSSDFVCAIQEFPDRERNGDCFNCCYFQIILRLSCYSGLITRV